MVDIFKPGVNKVFYKSKGFNGGILVTVEMVFPNLVDRIGLYLDEFEEGVYFLEYNFEFLGKYVGVFYENGKKAQVSSFLVVDSTFLGDSGYNNSSGVFISR